MDTSKAIELIEKSHHIGIILPHSPNLDHLFCAEALMRALKETQHSPVLLKNERLGEALREREQLITLLASSPLPLKEFIVSVDATLAPIAQLRYEKRDGGVEIILSPQSSPVTQSALSFREGKILCDCVIAVGMSRLEDADVPPWLPSNFFTETPLINIDSNSHNNTLYGDVNCVNENASSLGEVMGALLKDWNPSLLAKDTATLILASLLHKTGEVAAESHRAASTFLAISELVRSGADYAAARRAVSPPPPLNLLQLFARATVRSKHEEELDTLWSFLTTEDFMKTARTPRDVSRTLAYVAEVFPRPETTALLWEHPEQKTVRALLAGAPATLERIHANAGGQFLSPHLELPNDFPSFREAEDNLRTLIAEARSRTIE